MNYNNMIYITYNNTQHTITISLLDCYYFGSVQEDTFMISYKHESAFK